MHAFYVVPDLMSIGIPATGPLPSGNYKVLLANSRKDVPPPPPYDAFLLPAPPSQIALDPDLGGSAELGIFEFMLEILASSASKLAV